MNEKAEFAVRVLKQYALENGIPARSTSDLSPMETWLILHLLAVSGSLPTEEQVLQTIFDCVFIRGIELEDYKRNFTNEQSGLYDSLVKLFKGNDR